MSQTTLAELIERARTDRDFRDRAKTDLDGTLAAEGLTLSDDELEAARQMQAQAQGMSDEELDELLVGSADVTGHG